MGKCYLINVCTFSKVLNVGCYQRASPYGLHGVPIYILYLYDQMWLVGYSLPKKNSARPQLLLTFLLFIIEKHY